MLARASIVAVGAISPLGEGEAAFDPGALGQPARCAIEEDAIFLKAGFARPFAARAAQLTANEAPHVANKLLLHALGACVNHVSELGLLQGKRVRLALGTSSGGMEAAEQLFRLRAESPEGAQIAAQSVAAATYFAPQLRAIALLEAAGVVPQRALHLVTACAASTWALGVGLRWLEEGDCDLVFAGGYDALTTFVGAGFECLRATSASRPAPFGLTRDGMALGEGAGVVALVREGEEGRAQRRAFVSGFGASTDAVHVTAPDRNGDGLYRAGAAALADAGVGSQQCGLVSAHATATPFNDAMEWKAIERLFGAHAPYIHPFKAQIGHTLGAAGVLETLALARAVELGCIPAAVIPANPDPETPARLAPVTCEAPLQAGLKLSAAFGGANAALIVERADVAPSRNVRPARRAFVRNFAQVDAVDLERLALVTGQAQDKLERLDALSLLAASAVAQLQDSGALAGDSVGVVVGHSLATLDINERFFAKVLSKGPRFAEPKLFPPTSPNLVAGQLAILFGLRGPSAALAGGPGTALDSLALARTLVRCGDCQRVVVVAIDYLGETSRFVRAEAFAAHEDVQHGATVALVDSEAEGSLFELSGEPPRAGFGRIALLDYLRRQGS